MMLVMKIVWSGSKNRRLKAMRGGCFEDIVSILLEREYLAVLENRELSNLQKYAIVAINHHIG